MRTLGIMLLKRCRIPAETLDICPCRCHRLGMNHTYSTNCRNSRFSTCARSIRYRVLHDAVVRTRPKRKDILEQFMHETRRTHASEGRHQGT